MNQRLRARWVWPGTFFVGMLAILTASPTASIRAQEAMPATRSAGESLNSPMEPLAPVSSLSQAAGHLDETALSWTRQHRCGSCHTNYPYLVARPALKETASPRIAEVRRFFEERVAHWDDKDKAAKPRWDAEVVVDGRGAGDQRRGDDRQASSPDPQGARPDLDGPEARRGLRLAQVRLAPLEYDDYYGAIVAALGAGHAPDGYAQSPAAQAGLARLRAYFAKNPPPDLHHADDAALGLDPARRPDDRRAAEHDHRPAPRAPTSRRRLEPPLAGSTGNGATARPTIPKAPSDGYATGLGSFVLRQAGVPTSDPAIQRGVGWLCRTSAPRAVVHPLAE